MTRPWSTCHKDPESSRDGDTHVFTLKSLCKELVQKKEYSIYKIIQNTKKKKS